MTDGPPPPPHTTASWSTQPDSTVPPPNSPTQPVGNDAQSAAYGPPPTVGPTPTITKPTAVLVAQVLMYVGGALALIGAVTTTVSTVGLWRRTDSDGLYGPGWWAFTIVSSAIPVGLWFWMAWANGKGWPWARIVATILFALAVVRTFSMALIIFQHMAAPIFVLATGVSLLIGAVSVLLLWVGTGSNEYFGRVNTP